MSTKEDQKAWSDEKTQKLIAMWNDGKSAGTLGSYFKVSKNVIIGRVGRLRQRGIFVRSKSVSDKKTGTASPRTRKKITKPSEGPSTGYVITKKTVMGAQKIRDLTAYGKSVVSCMETETRSTGITLSNLPRTACKWPLSGSGEAMQFCGEPATKKSYCACHAARVYA